MIDYWLHAYKLKEKRHRETNVKRLENKFPKECENNLRTIGNKNNKKHRGEIHRMIDKIRTKEKLTCF